MSVAVSLLASTTLAVGVAAFGVKLMLGFVPRKVRS